MPIVADDFYPPEEDEFEEEACPVCSCNCESEECFCDLMKCAFCEPSCFRYDGY